jgi:nucleoid DNA-binding protein
MTDQKFKTVEVKAPWIAKTNGTLNIQDVIQMVKHKSNIQYKQCFTAEHDKTIFKVWNTLSTFIKEQMLAKKNVNIRDFGSFSFDIATENPSSLKNNSSTDREELRRVNKTNHSARPCFIVGKKFKQCLLR